MKRQIVIIHGGNSFSSYENYINYLKDLEIDIDYFRSHNDWKGKLQENLGDGFDVLFPSMPNKTNARYEEWKIWFEKIIPCLDKEIIFIGHSLGGIFLSKYLSENIVPREIKAVILVASPFNEPSLDEFPLPKTLNKFLDQVSKIYLIQSKDDPVVPFQELEKYKNLLPSAIPLTFENRGHFNEEDFPEIIDLIKKIR
jgi:uncharacterized protein